MARVIYSLEILSILYVIAIIYGMLSQAQERDKKHSIFLVTLFFNIAILGIDANSWYLEGKQGFDTWQEALLALEEILISVIVLIFLHYLLIFIGERRPVSNKPLYLMIAIVAANVTMIAVSAYAGCFITYENGAAHYWLYYNIAVGVHVLIILLALATVLFYHKALSKIELVSVLIYMLLPIAAALADISVSNGSSMSVVAMPLSTLIVYITIQGQQVSMAKAREQTQREVSETDELTGLRNRRAFYQDVSPETDDGGTFGLVYCDVNGLKYANDHFGHLAGDKLLTEFTQLMSGYFSGMPCYRLGGDEFTAIVRGMNEDEFSAYVEGFRKVITENDRIASVGYAIGSYSEKSAVFKAAEKAMYNDKSDYYRMSGRDRRNR